MSFVYTILGSVADTAGFSKAGETWASERLKTLGAQSVAASQIIMGGELAGKVLISFETKTIDAAMSLQTGIYADKELVALIQDTGVSIDRRNLMRRQAEFGERSGQYLSALYVNSESVDDGTAQKNFARPWENMKKGANGLKLWKTRTPGLISLLRKSTISAPSQAEVNGSNHGETPFSDRKRK